MFYIRNLFLTISFLCSALITLGDSMGSITSLTRNGRQDGGTYGKVNQLTYGYDGNRLVSVSDAVASPTYNGFFGFSDGASQSVEYEYDANGNMTRDRNKGISSIQYNADNLPLRIQYDNGSRATYLYAADGTKLQVRYETSYAGLLSSGPPSGSASTAIAQTHTIDYVGNKIYEDGTLKKILVDGGYVDYNGGSPIYHAYLTDHQGNVRVVVDENSTVKQVNHYYPYGGLMAESTGGDVQRYKYNGKELDRMHGLDWYDHGARHNDAAIGRWHSMDEKCEKYYDVSPYAYCGDNPVIRIDKDGKIWETVWDATNLVLGFKSMADNVEAGNVGAAVVDGVGIVIDATAAVLPFVPGGAGTAIKSLRGVDKVTNVQQDVKAFSSSRAARRAVMRDQKIPNSQQPKSQSRNAAGREYRYDVPKQGGGTKEKSVQQQTLDRSHKEQPHWEAGDIKTDKRTNKNLLNSYNRPKLTSDKSKRYYDPNK